MSFTCMVRYEFFQRSMIYWYFLNFQPSISCGPNHLCRNDSFKRKSNCVGGGARRLLPESVCTTHPVGCPRIPRSAAPPTAAFASAGVEKNTTARPLYRRSAASAPGNSCSTSSSVTSEGGARGLLGSKSNGETEACQNGNKQTQKQPQRLTNRRMYAKTDAGQKNKTLAPEHGNAQQCPPPHTQKKKSSVYARCFPLKSLGVLSTAAKQNPL